MVVSKSEKEAKKRRRKARKKAVRIAMAQEKVIKVEPTAKLAKKAGKIRQRYDKMTNEYLYSILEPFDYVGCKIPDLETYPSTTFFVRQRWTIPSDANGLFAAMITPWHKNMFFNNMTFPNTGIAGQTMTWSAISGIDAAQEATILANFAMARPVSCGIKLSYIGSVLNAQGTLAAAIYDPSTTLPSTYAQLTQGPDFTETSISADSASIEVRWKPMSLLNQNYIPIAYYPVPNGAAQFWFPTSATANTAAYCQAQWAANLSGAVARMMPFNHPVIVVAASGLPAGGPMAAPLIKVEVIVNFEATIQSQTLALGGQVSVTPSPTNLAHMEQVSQVLPKIPVARMSKSSNFVESAQRFLSGAGTVANVVAKVAPMVAALI